jgi:hypothetical protein
MIHVFDHKADPHMISVFAESEEELGWALARALESAAVMSEMVCPIVTLASATNFIEQDGADQVAFGRAAQKVMSPEERKSEPPKAV